MKWIIILTMSMASMSCDQNLTAEYPKSRVIREGWRFAVDSMAAFSPENVLAKADWRQVDLPLSWQAQYDDLREYQGIGWYSLSIKNPGLEVGERLVMKFAAVDYKTWVYLNGEQLVSHEGGYTPFTADLTEHLNPGENDLLVRVLDPVDTEEGSEGISLWSVPRGKQSWYVQNSGIWRDVSLSVRQDHHIKNARISPEMDGSVDVQIMMAGATSTGSTSEMKLRVFDQDGQVVYKKSQAYNPGTDTLNITCKIDDPRLWHFESPHLYKLEIVLANGEGFEDRFGFRTIETHNGQMLLNGKPFFMIAALDQDFYPDSIYTTPSRAYLMDQAFKAKALGLNTLRCHIKIPVEEYLDVADEVGLLVWYEVPNWDVFTPEAASRGETLMDEALARDWNHPSLVVLGIINESWGLDMKQADQREWLVKEYDRVKKHCGGRLVVDNSACWGNFHLKTDINDYHTYWAIPENRHRFNQTLDDVLSRPDWLFSKSGDSQETGQEPLMISEFGNWGLPVFDEDKPFWLERDFLGRHITLPAGYLERFVNFTYDALFGSYEKLAYASQTAQFHALKYEIENIRLREGFKGYVITELTDINWESNGLMTMWRQPKANQKELSWIQQQNIIIPVTNQYNYFAGESIELELFGATFKPWPSKPSHIHWEGLDGRSGDIPYDSDADIGVARMAQHSIPTPLKPTQPGYKIEWTLLDEQGNTLARNFSEFYVYEQPEPQGHNFEIRGFSEQQATDLRNLLEVEVAEKTDQLLVTDRLDAAILSEIEQGRNVVCVVNENTSFDPRVPVKLTSRDEEWYDGNWASNFNWWRFEDDILAGIADNAGIGFQIAECSPKMVMTDIPEKEFESVLAGMFVGWIHLNSAYILEARLGQGQLLITTLPLVENLTEDPFSSALFNQILTRMGQTDADAVWKWKL